MAMNDFLKGALAQRKKMVDESSSTSAIGTGTGLIEDKPTLSKLPFYTGDMVDKSDTGYTGLLNQGATCYLNSMLQSLFMTPELREAVFEWRYDPEKDPEEKRCIPLQLQRLFAELQISIKGAVRTQGLTTSFGWTGREVYQQHDVLELSNVLFENLETQAFGSKLAMVVSDLHRGTYKDYVQCLKCQTQRGRTVPFVGLGLDISNANTFEEAMRQYITPEILDGGNKVTCTPCDSKQDSKKGIRLTALPYFLGIHLKRWTFNFHTLQRIKLNKKIAFPQRFDGAMFLNCDGNASPDVVSTDDSKNDDGDSMTAKSKDAMEYELYSMLIHTGGATGGHYFAYIKDFETGKWMQFNDSNVQEIPSEDIEKWFSPRIEHKAEEQKDDKKESDTNTVNKSDDRSNNKKNDDDDNKPSVVPAPVPETEESAAIAMAQKHGGGLDIAAAIKQNVVSKQQQKSVSDKMKEDAKKRPRFLDPYGAAYMVTYRRIDKEKNVMKVDNALIPENVVQDIEEKDQVFAKQKAEYDRLRQFTTFKVHFDGAVTEVMVKKKETMKKARQTVFDEMKMSQRGVVNVECIRLRNMRVLNAVPLQPYDGDVLEELVESFKFHDPKHLMLETRTEEEEFPVWEKEKVSIRMIELDVESMEWKKEVVVQVDDDAKIGALRAKVAETMKVEEVDRIRMAYHTEGLAMLLSDDKKRLKKDERILNGATVNFEICTQGSSHLEGSSKMMKKFDDALNTLHLMYNKLEYDVNAADIFTEFIDIDVRSTVGALREILAQKLGLKVEELRLRKGFHQQELKDNAKTLQEYRVHSNGQLFVEKGRPLQPTEYLFQIFIEDEVYIRKKAEMEKRKWAEFVQKEREKEEQQTDGTKETTKEAVKSGVSEKVDLGDAFLFVGDCVLDEEWSMERVKQSITENVANVPPANRMRLRSFNDHNRLMKVYLDSKTLKQNLKRSIKDYTQVCCQVTMTEDEHFTSDKILLYVARWYPEKMDFGPHIEYAFTKKTKIKSELREELSKLSGIPVEHIRTEHPRPYLLKNPENRRKICVLDWENTNCGDGSTLTAKPWKCKSGDFVLYKDSREPEKLTKEDFETKSIVSLVAQPEAALVFYSPQEQIEREKQKMEKEKEHKLEFEKAQKEAIERMKQSSAVAAKAAQKSMEKAIEDQ